MSMIRSTPRWRPIMAAVAAVVVLGLVGAGIVRRETRAEPSPPAPPPAVLVKALAPEHIRPWSSFSGRLKAVDEALVRPEISGRIVEVRIKDGQNVRAGEVMFVIDPRPYEAALAKAKADAAAARAQAELAAIEFERAKSLIGSQAIPQSLYDQRANAHRVAQATLLSQNAALRQASINLDYAYVKAPIPGRVSRAEITLGNLVQAGSNAPVLTKIVSNESIYADFEVDEQSYVQTIRNRADTQSKEQQIPVEMRVQGDVGHVYDGSIYTFDNSLDVTSGTIRARAKFSNKDGALLPGMFVSIRLASSSETDAILVPDAAIGSDQSKKFVYVVGPDNKVAYRDVRLGVGIDGRHIVLAGLNAGDRVVMTGLQFVKPDVVVTPKVAAEADLKTASTNSESAVRSRRRPE